MAVEQHMDRIAKALGRIPSGAAVVTAKAGPRRAALLASWIQQAGFDPPMISVAIKKGRPIESVIDSSGAFAVNVLGEGDQEAMFKHFASGFAPQEDPFVGLKATDVPGGVDVTRRIACLSAAVHGKHDAGDHWLYLGTVTAADIGEIKQPYVHLRSDGMSY